MLTLKLNKPKLSRLYAYYTFLLKETATLTNTLLTRLEAYKLISQRFRKIYYPLMTIAYLCDLTARNKRPVNIINKQIRGIGGWLLRHYKNNEKKASIVYAEL